MTIRSFHIACAFISTGLLFSAPIVAQTRQPVVVEIATADLNLASAAGRKALSSRVRHAIGRACGSNVVGAGKYGDTAQCVREMRTDSRVKISALTGDAPVQIASR